MFITQISFINSMHLVDFHEWKKNNHLDNVGK